MSSDNIIDSIFEDSNFEWLCQADTEDINRYKGKIKRKLNKKQRELLDKIKSMERDSKTRPYCLK